MQLRVSRAVMMPLLQHPARRILNLHSQQPAAEDDSLKTLPFRHPKLLILPSGEAVWPATVFGWIRFTSQRDDNKRATVLLGYFESLNDGLPSPGAPPPLYNDLAAWGIRHVYRNRTIEKYGLGIASARSVIGRAPMFRNLSDFGFKGAQRSNANHSTWGWMMTEAAEHNFNF